MKGRMAIVELTNTKLRVKESSGFVIFQIPKSSNVRGWEDVGTVALDPQSAQSDCPPEIDFNMALNYALEVMPDEIDHPNPFNTEEESEILAAISFVLGRKVEI